MQTSLTLGRRSGRCMGTELPCESGGPCGDKPCPPFQQQARRLSLESLDAGDEWYGLLNGRFRSFSAITRSSAPMSAAAAGGPSLSKVPPQRGRSVSEDFAASHVPGGAGGSAVPTQFPPLSPPHSACAIDGLLHSLALLSTLESWTPSPTGTTATSTGERAHCCSRGSNSSTDEDVTFSFREGYCEIVPLPVHVRCILATNSS